MASNGASGESSDTSMVKKFRPSSLGMKISEIWASSQSSVPHNDSNAVLAWIIFALDSSQPSSTITPIGAFAKSPENSCDVADSSSSAFKSGAEPALGDRPKLECPCKATVAIRSPCPTSCQVANNTTGVIIPRWVISRVSALSCRPGSFGLSSKISGLSMSSRICSGNCPLGAPTQRSSCLLYTSPSPRDA